MVRTFRNPQGGSLGGVFDAPRERSHANQYEDQPKSGGLSSSSEEFSSPIPNQMNPNHQFSPTMQSYYVPPPNVASGPQTHSRRGVAYPPPYANSPAGAAQQLAGTPVRDPLGNLYFLPKYPPENPPQLCQLCRSIFGGAGAPHPEYHPHYHHPHYHPPPQGHAVDYDDLLNQKRRAELQYRNAVDPFVNGGMKGSNSETFLTRVAEPPPPHEDFGLANGLNDLSGVLSRLQNNLQDPDDSTVLTSMSYPNSAANGVPNNPNNRQSWSAPQDPFGFKGPNSIMNGGVKTGPGDGPTYGRAKMQAERTRIRQMAMNGSLSDPLEPVLRGRRNSFSQPVNNEGYSPSMYDEQQNSKRGNSLGRDGKYLKDLEDQINEKKERRKREVESQQDWWEKRKDPPFTVKMPNRPHPSQHEPTADQRPDPRMQVLSLQEELKMQMELKKKRESEEKAREREEEAKLERRIQEQQERMKREFDEEQSKKKAKEQAKLKRQEDMAKRQQEIQKEAERAKKEAAERKFQERKAARQRRQDEERDSSRGSTPVNGGPRNRSDSPPIPTIRNSQGNSSNSEFESASMGLSSEDDQESAALNQLSKMRQQLDKKQESLEDEDQPNQGRRRSSVWEGLAEV